MQNPS